MNPLSNHELSQSGVIKIVELIKDKIDKYRILNDEPEQDDAIRYSIMELRHLLKTLGEKQ